MEAGACGEPDTATLLPGERWGQDLASAGLEEGTGCWCGHCHLEEEFCRLQSWRLSKTPAAGVCLRLSGQASKKCPQLGGAGLSLH